MSTFVCYFGASQDAFYPTCALILLDCINSFPSRPLNTRRSSREMIKNSQKKALLPFASKFGVQEVDKCSQLPGDFGLRHLNVSYMTNFLK